VATAVAAFFTRLKTRLPNSEVRVMVGMAEGADLLVAQIALEHGFGVDAVLPMPMEDYAADFSAHNLEVLRKLLRHPGVRHVELQLPLQPGEERETLYVNLRDSLLRCSALLLAVWDGKPSPRPGGTADNVLHFLAALSNARHREQALQFVDSEQDEPADSQFVYWVPTERSSSATSRPQRSPCYLSGASESVLLCHATMPRQLEHRLRELDAYNREFHELLDGSGRALTDSLLNALPADMPVPHRETLERLDSEYGRADALAIYHQRRSDLLFKILGGATFSTGFLYLLYEKIFESPTLLFGYVIVLLSGYAVFHRVRRHHWFSKHLVYRALAETMRVKFFLRLSGAEHVVDARELVALSGIDQFEGFGFVTMVIKSVEPFDFAGTPHGTDARQIESVDRAWIGNQESYFRRKVAGLERASLRLKRMRHGLVIVVLLLVLTLAFFAEPLHHIRVALGRSAKDLLTFGMGFGVVTLGAWELYQNKMATRELLWQYRNQLGHFARARRQLARTAGVDSRRAVLTDLGKDCLMESYLWTIHRYHREHEPPGG